MRHQIVPLSLLVLQAKRAAAAGLEANRLDRRAPQDSTEFGRRRRMSCEKTSKRISTALVSMLLQAKRAASEASEVNRLDRRAPQDSTEFGRRRRMSCEKTSKRISTALVSMLLLLPSTGLAASLATSSTAENLSLDRYVRAHREASNTLKQRSLDVALSGVEIERRRERATQDLRAAPRVGGRLYHYTSNFDLDPLLEIGGTADYVYRDNGGTTYGVTGRTFFPTSKNRVTGNILYGVDANVGLPLLRNRSGREFEIEVQVFEHQKKRAEADLDNEALVVCADAIERYVIRYAAQEQLTTYQSLVKEKRRVWYQTASDFKKKMITRLDLLAARSDWLYAQSQVPTFKARLDRADAALRAFYPRRTSLTLAPPPEIFTTTTAEPNIHPQLRAIEALDRSLEEQIALVQEQDGDTLDLSLIAGVDRFHFLADPNGRGADITDIHALVGLSYLWSIEAPETAYQIRALRLSREQLGEQKQDLLRQLKTARLQAQATRLREAEAIELLTQQLKVLGSQIRAAYQEFRAGKLEFQNYLDHWERYQRARLSIWDHRIARWLAEINLIPLRERPPGICHAQAD